MGGAGRFVFVSTRAVSPEGGAYSRSKLLAEEAVRPGRPFVIVRLPEIYGLGVRGIDRSSSTPGPGAGSRSPSPTGRWCARFTGRHRPAIAALSTARPARQDVYLAGECLSLREFAKLCEQRFGRRLRSSACRAWVSAAAAMSRFLPLPVYPDQLSRLLAAKPEPSPDAERDLGFHPRCPPKGWRRSHDRLRARRACHGGQYGTRRRRGLIRVWLATYGVVIAGIGVWHFTHDVPSDD